MPLAVCLHIDSIASALIFSRGGRESSALTRTGKIKRASQLVGWICSARPVFFCQPWSLSCHTLSRRGQRYQCFKRQRSGRRGAPVRKGTVAPVPIVMPLGRAVRLSLPLAGGRLMASCGCNRWRPTTADLRKNGNPSQWGRHRPSAGGAGQHLVVTTFDLVVSRVCLSSSLCSAGKSESSSNAAGLKLVHLLSLPDDSTRARCWSGMVNEM
jgi:hypothetical protein